jgi:hypothetical protein
VLIAFAWHLRRRRAGGVLWLFRCWRLSGAAPLVPNK